MRPNLFIELERLHGDLQVNDVVCELWIDGNFLTQKEEPNDIDLAFACYADDFDALEPHVQSDVWALLNGGKQYSPGLDTYLCFRFRREDPRASLDGTRDWSEKWGIGWDDRLKGFAVIKLGETDVGLRLFA